MRIDVKIKMFRYSSLAGSLNEFEEKVNDFMKDFEIATVEQKVIPNKNGGYSIYILILYK